ncbi:MAG: acyl-phosphate glycerol 3-phosphate acyltransferase [Sphingomonadales bacterium 35-56-22]|jgi:glycerol-3-phosphate acyltransferase PlsY|uniref:glycerol-3-phosphate 1-O-acyltransferase PlsY n=1 Tax=Sphingorhabdus sp. TaxID=1902408 RepID=UPI000BC6E4C6|nr:glycerol-3-phosphate 1-O-acyltransferase PlsY [Sphingorhabdus sp.]OYY15506.1 MAG: acyl-phosphate glycerol 3-phosphate acyltransferase [Sphingomonadales bacterium 35-56-22]OYY98724.1 MAG: acyl-phosphate glycerol 3-phosphate acyltransferase [Sphingomonadales bacterium 28-56-43]OYZ60904.1 MAG: acyl-phosphate glycerol 3-phosphate acyltransferase [Sphingomonadales bacterium 24-56-14]OZA83870.1 MAG: acyl-phosphate glycerol 3-phosphate acyltransferase [Sphingomonadales bacterium 39-57-19]HQS11511.
MDDIGFNMIAGLLLGYLLGSIPFGLLLTKASGGGDIRNIGSGNIGATNVLRTGRKGLAALTLLLDLLKGFFAVFIATHYLPGGAAFAAAGAFFGHLYPVWLGFKGGKGVATYAGIMFGLFWQGGVVYAIAWIGALLIFRISSLAGLLAALCAPIAAAYFGRYDLVALLVACTLIVFWKHRTNIESLLDGTEPRIGKSKS